MARGIRCGALAAVTAIALMAVSPAHGVKRYYKTGRPGTATMPPMYGWYGGFTLDHTLRFSSRSVQRSPARRGQWQRICVRYRLYHFLPSSLGERPQWASAWNDLSCVDVRPGYHANFAARDFRPIPVKAYNAEVWLTWHVGRRRVGSARYDYNRTGDYSCQTIKCSTDYGYQNVAYIMFDY